MAKSKRLRQTRGFNFFVSMSSISCSILFSFSLIFLSSCSFPETPSTENTPETQWKSYEIPENKSSFTYPSEWGDVVSERLGEDMSCPPLKEGEVNICAVMGNWRTLSFSLRNDLFLEFFSRDIWDEVGYLGKILRFCPVQLKGKPLFVDEDIGYCNQTKEGNITFTTFSQIPEQEKKEDTVVQLIFFPLQQEKYEGLIVYKILPLSQNCEGLVRNGFMSESEKENCIQESISLFSDVSSKDQEEILFSQFLKRLSSKEFLF